MDEFLQVLGQGDGHGSEGEPNGRPGSIIASGCHGVLDHDSPHHTAVGPKLKQAMMHLCHAFAAGDIPSTDLSDLTTALAALPEDLQVHQAPAGIAVLPRFPCVPTSSLQAEVHNVFVDVVWLVGLPPDPGSCQRRNCLLRTDLELPKEKPEDKGKLGPLVAALHVCPPRMGPEPHVWPPPARLRDMRPAAARRGAKAFFDGAPG